MRVPRARLTAVFLAWLGLLLAAGPACAATAKVKDVRLWSGPEGTRLVIELSAPVEYDVFPLDKPDRVVVDLANTTLGAQDLPAGQGPVRQLRSGPQPGRGLRFVLDLDSPQAPKSFVVGPEGSAGHRIVVELPGKTVPVVAAPATAQPAGTAAPTGKEVLAMVAETSRGMATPPVDVPRVNDPPPASAVKSIASTAKGRDLVIAIDAGHGGQDPGAIGRGGAREKDVTLAIARRLAAEIDAQEGMRAVLIRDGDHFLTLAGRTRKARRLGADMFVSIHADSVLRREVSGSSVYVLSLRGASDEAARWLAESENAADLKGGVPLVEDDLLASVLLDVTQKEAISDSVEAADNVLAALASVGTVHGARRVRHAGFVVLKSPDIPSMLVETGFISNAGDERRLRDTGHQQKIAAAIRAGVRNYWYDNPPPGTRLAALVAERRGGTAQAGQTLAGK
ncbi:MAG TPA: N-acetylmuramoyl-L-alanine amidase [Steroidobacteraceae bacterium]|nr:N-acetylmuramoyl-L-alanine amidase [Steroidobacteraceae bacterium]